MDFHFFLSWRECCATTGIPEAGGRCKGRKHSECQENPGVQKAIGGGEDCKDPSQALPKVRTSSQPQQLNSVTVRMQTVSFQLSDF